MPEECQDKNTRCLHQKQLEKDNKQGLFSDRTEHPATLGVRRQLEATHVQSQQLTTNWSTVLKLLTKLLKMTSPNGFQQDFDQSEWNEGELTQLLEGMQNTSLVDQQSIQPADSADIKEDTTVVEDMGKPDILNDPYDSHWLEELLATEYPIQAVKNCPGETTLKAVAPSPQLPASLRVPYKEAMVKNDQSPSAQENLRVSDSIKEPVLKVTGPPVLKATGEKPRRGKGEALPAPTPPTDPAASCQDLAMNLYLSDSSLGSPSNLDSDALLSESDSEPATNQPAVVGQPALPQPAVATAGTLPQPAVGRRSQTPKRTTPTSRQMMSSKRKESSPLSSPIKALKQPPERSSDSSKMGPAHPQ